MDPAVKMKAPAGCGPRIYDVSCSVCNLWMDSLPVAAALDFKAYGIDGFGVSAGTYTELRLVEAMRCGGKR